MQLLLGLKAPTSTFFCLYCECTKNQRSNMDIKWANDENKKGILFKFIWFIFKIYSIIIYYY